MNCSEGALPVAREQPPSIDQTTTRIFLCWEQETLGSFIVSGVRCKSAAATETFVWPVLGNELRSSTFFFSCRPSLDTGTGHWILDNRMSPVVRGPMKMGKMRRGDS